VNSALIETQGNNFTYDTLSVMAAIVRRDVTLKNVKNEQTIKDAIALRKFTGKLLQNVQGHDFSKEIETIFKFVRDKIRYQRDNIGLEVVQDATRTIFEYGFGDCDDKSVCLSTLLGIAGHLSRFKVIGFGQQIWKFNHVYVQVYDKTKRKWISVDATNERAEVGWKAENYSHSSIFPIFK